ncbi:transcription factor bHLH140-like [Pyrus x bretschneideri]|uniref:transcription factor bHLH140-like n=1 Tax=Pyrus x bretschneideri TaxID=225117 RepID=UPI00202FD784|nr:transcription factor bHLH140-like [Pyrus x bretschneideri]
MRKHDQDQDQEPIEEEEEATQREAGKGIERRVVRLEKLLEMSKAEYPLRSCRRADYLRDSKSKGKDPSMRQLHLHVISQDFDSIHLKNKKQWNSFNTAFFRDSMDAIEEVSSDGKAKLKDDDSLLSTELRCHRCRRAHPNMPRLKSHITDCRAPFPSTLLQNGRLVHAPSNVSIDP